MRVEKRDIKNSLGVSVLESAVETASERVTHEAGTFSGDDGGTSLLGSGYVWFVCSLAIANFSEKVLLYMGQLRA